jgi:hypothetical protein
MLTQTEIESRFEIIGQSKDNIVIIDNFVSKEILYILDNFIKEKTSEMTTDFNYLSKKMFKDESPEVFEVFIDLEKKIPKYINEYLKKFNIKVEEKPLFNMSFASRIPNTKMEEHFDYMPAEASNGNPLAHMTSLIYINDDYNGGELFFPTQNLTYKPELGSLVIFPSNYLHGVLECFGNSRHSVLACYTFV